LNREPSGEVVICPSCRIDVRLGNDPTLA
jgi:hypothetical protein